MKLYYIKPAILLLGASLLNSVPALAQAFIPEGPWRGVFHNTNGTEVPFNFEVKGKTASTAKLYLLNAEERFEAGAITQKSRFFICLF